MDGSDYCRQIEAHLCRKNEGHLVRVVGPAFDIVSQWATDGVPIKVAFLGIDRYVERYYRKGPRRRPVRIDACRADVLDAFDEWRRATGVTSTTAAEEQPGRPARRGTSLPEHLERVVTRLSSARAMGRLPAEADPLIDGLSSELDRARASASGLRGPARQALLDRLAAADVELLAVARRTLDAGAIDAMERAAEEELAGFRGHMAADRYAAARAAATNQLVREHLGLPTIVFA